MPPAPSNLLRRLRLLARGLSGRLGGSLLFQPTDRHIRNADEPQEDRDDIIRKLESMPLEKARQTAINLMESWNPKKIQGKASKNRVIFDIKKAFTSADICVIMYRLQLAQEGLATVNSKWKQHYRNV